MRRKILAVLLALAVLLPIIPAAADQLYIIPDSDTRELTREELWGYKYDTLKYAFNEIYARHGYKFETGSPCYMWFTQMSWYIPNESESSTNHHEAYSQCSMIENYNVDLIKDVRREMRELGTLNSNGIGMPTPPDPGVDKPRGFTFVNLKTGQKLAVMSAPGENAFRANNGKALVNTSGSVYALGWDSGWMLMLYEANHAGQYRVGYINGSKIKGTLPILPYLTWEWQSCQVQSTVNLTDDPALTGNPMGMIPQGTTVSYLTTMYNSGAWDYVETIIDGKTARGFIPNGYLNIDTAPDADDGNG